MIEWHGLEMTLAAVDQARIKKGQVRSSELAAAKFETCEGRAFGHHRPESG
jgi:hypothetical protein